MPDRWICLLRSATQRYPLYPIIVLVFTDLSVQDYLRSLAKDEKKGDRLLLFYMDQQHFTLYEEGFSVLENAEAFLKKNWQGESFGLDDSSHS